MKYYRILTLALLITLTPHLAQATQEQTSIKSPSDTAREKILALLAGEWVSRGLYVAAKLELADHLEAGPRSIEDLAGLTSSDPNSLYRLMNMLAGFSVFEEIAPKTFANTDNSRLLMKNNPESLRALSIFYGEDMHKSWDELLPSIQTGTPAFQLAFKQPVFAFFKENPPRAALFQEAMKEKSKAVIKSAIDTYNFGKFQSICDIGGGQGQFVQALLHAYPHLTGTIFELPEVIEKIKQSPLKENPRCKLTSGDFFVTIPSGADAYLLKSVLHDWDDAKCQQILKNCHDAMGPDSQLLIVEVVLLPKNKSLYANCMDLLMLTVTGGKERTLSAFNEMLDKAGFVLESTHTTSTEFSILQARKK